MGPVGAIYLLMGLSYLILHIIGNGSINSSILHFCQICSFVIIALQLMPCHCFLIIFFGVRINVKKLKFIPSSVMLLASLNWS